VGCGITGSWVLPVLVRACKSVAVFDDDIIDPTNLHGLWHLPKGPKAAGVVERRFRNRISVHPKRILRPGDFRHAFDLVVLCPDNAPARQLVGRILAKRITRKLTKVLDVRATPGGLVVWSIGNRNSWAGWMKSLKGYPLAMPCDHHDNVPIEAGATATGFVAWWLSHGMPEGIWNRTYGPE